MNYLLKTTMLCLLFSTSFMCMAQSRYIKYCRLISKSMITENAILKEKYLSESRKMGKGYDDVFLKGIDSLNAVSPFRTKSKLVKRYALHGYTLNNESNLYSIISADGKLENEYSKKFNKFLRTKCDLTESLKILELFQRDQNVREFTRFENMDSVDYERRSNTMTFVDSTNYISLQKILHSSHFQPERLMKEAIMAFSIILIHNATNNYTNGDSIYGYLRKLMETGLISNIFYASAYDRYYMFKYGYNYYCSLYDSRAGIFDIANIDRRRWEIGLYPLYYKFKLSGKLENIPKEYVYDSAIIKE